MTNYLIIVDANENPIGYYSDEYQYYYDIWVEDIDEVEIYPVNDKGYEQVRDEVGHLNDCVLRDTLKNDVKVKFPLNIAVADSQRKIISIVNEEDKGDAFK